MVKWLPVSRPTNPTLIVSRMTSVTVKAMVNKMYALGRISCYEPHLTSSLDDTMKMLDKPVQKLLRKKSSNVTLK